MTLSTSSYQVIGLGLPFDTMSTSSYQVLLFLFSGRSMSPVITCPKKIIIFVRGKKKKINKNKIRTIKWFIIGITKCYTIQDPFKIKSSSYMCTGVKGIDFVPVFAIFLLEFVTVPSVMYFMFFLSLLHYSFNYISLVYVFKTVRVIL